MEDYSTRIVDRVPQFDERSRAYSAVVGIESKPLRSYTWSCDVYNDQGQEGACVGFMWSHELSARPRIVRRDAAYALKIYNRAKQIDYWDGEDYSGTSVLAGIKALQEETNAYGKQLISEYRWGFGVEDVARIIGYKGPVGLGIDWYYGMYTPDVNGFIKPVGSLVGGHAIMANGIKIVKIDSSLPADWSNVDLDKSYVRLHNSWGTGYGKGGDAFITLRDLDKLLQDGGEACIPTIRYSE